MVRIPKANGCRCTRAENYHKMMETIRRVEEAKRSQPNGIQVPPFSSSLLPIESQSNGPLMLGAPQAQDPFSTFQFNDLRMALPGREANEQSSRGQPSVLQANAGEMTNPVFNESHALPSVEVSNQSVSFPTLPSVGVSDHPSSSTGMVLGGCSDHSTPFSSPMQVPDYFGQFSGFFPPQYPPPSVDRAVAPPADSFNPNQFPNLCNCGPNCQCEICAVHPFNPASKLFVQDLADIMALDMGNPEPYSNEGFPPGAFPPSVDPRLLGDMGHMTRGTGDSQLPMNGYQTNFDSASNAYPDGPMFPPQQPTQHYAHSENYFEFQYPFFGPMSNICSNIDGSCRCGENCACEGCLTHQGHRA